MAFFVIERGVGKGQRIALTKFPVLVGRDSTNNIVLVDSEISRYHFRVKKRGGLYILEDLESKNGTYINGDKAINSTLHNGDKILVGNTQLLFLASQPNIQITNEIIHFDMDISEDFNLSETLEEFDKENKSDKYKPVRIEPSALIPLARSQGQAIKEVNEHHENLIVIDNIFEACNSFLKIVNRLMPKVARAALFIWSKSSRQLIPFSLKNFNKEQRFLFCHRALEDSITRKQVIVIPANMSEKNPSRNIAILPMIHHGEAICLIHIEFDKSVNKMGEYDLSKIQNLLERSSAIFEAMLLRRELDTWLVGMIETMIATVEAKDTYTSGHSERVSRYCMAIAEELKLNREIKRLLMISSLCHDIGKIGIPDNILKKTSHLSAEEYQEMKLHPTMGADIISHMPNSQRFISGVKYHHEKWDGSGYPEGLKGEEIPFFGRIIAIADGFDAMVSGRVYSGFMNQDEAVEKLYEEKHLYDLEIFKTFIKAHENGTLTLKTTTQNNELPQSKVTGSAIKTVSPGVKKDEDD